MKGLTRSFPEDAPEFAVCRDARGWQSIRGGYVLRRRAHRAAGAFSNPAPG